MALTRERIIEIANETRGQRTNPIWHEYRKNRLTASLFGNAINAIRASHVSGNKTSSHRLVNTMMHPPNLDHIPAIKWGVEHERDAIKDYEAKNGYKVNDTGIWLFPDGYLGASPDGLLLDPNSPHEVIGCIEVKCPYRLIDDPIKHKDDWHKLIPFLDHENKLLKNPHYYHQVQGHLMATGLNWCDFIVWSASHILIHRIYPDEEWFTQTSEALLEF